MKRGRTFSDMTREERGAFLAGAAAMRDAAAGEAEKRAKRHRESMGGSSIDALHGAMADAYVGLARRIRALHVAPG